MNPPHFKSSPSLVLFSPTLATKQKTLAPILGKSITPFIKGRGSHYD